MKAIFVAGVHGVGKSHLCSPQVNASTVFQSASAIIKAELTSPNWGVDKIVKDVDSNQLALMQGFRRIKETNPGKNVLLDGHFVLRGPSGLQCIDFDVFKGLGLDEVILVTDSADAVRERVLSRDSLKIIDDLEEFMALEEKRAREFCRELGLRFHIVRSGDFQEFEAILKDAFNRTEV